MQCKFILLALLFCSNLSAEILPQLRFSDKVRIKEAMTISAGFGEQLFRGYSTVPFAIILVTDSTEFLLNHPNPSPDFISLGKDEFLKTVVYYRPKQFSPHFLATFPAVNGLSCIVVGTPENTNKSSTEWIITLLHEHLHQYQSTVQSYYEKVTDLGLSGGDQTGMWMLNYPFPYDSMPVKRQYEVFTKALHKIIISLDTKDHQENLKNYLTERRKFTSLLSPADYRYFSFQIWQEGLARYTEFKFLELLESYTPSKEVSDLPDYISFPQIKRNMFKNETANLEKNKLDKQQRVCFYSVGFAEGILLDKLNPSWRSRYLADLFNIERYATIYNQ
jgi:hypothetical protein